MKLPASSDDQAILRSPLAGPRVIRGGAIRSVGYGIGILLAVPTSVLLLRHLGVVDFGRYVTVTALLGIVAGITDFGLTTVAGRELATEEEPSRRRELLSTFLAVRLVTASLGVAGAVLFAIAVGYDAVLVAGTLIGGVAVVLTAPQTTLTLPLWLNLRMATVTAIDLLRPTLLLAGVAIVVSLGGQVLSLFVVLAATSMVALLATMAIVGRDALIAPSLDLKRVKQLIRIAAPMSIASSIHYLYFGSLVVVVSLVGTATDTGLFGTSFRIFELLLALPALVLGVTFPVLSVAGAEDQERLRFGLQRVVEVGVVLGAFLALLCAILAEPVVELLGGQQFAGAGAVLRIQGFALVPIFVSQALVFGLLAIRKDRLLILTSSTALVLAWALSVVLVPAIGAEGAAWAGLAAEVAICGLLFGCLGVVRPELQPSLRFAWKIGVCAGVGAASFGLPGTSPYVRAVVAAGLYAISVVVLRALPSDVISHLVPVHLRRIRPFARSVSPSDLDRGS